MQPASRRTVEIVEIVGADVDRVEDEDLDFAAQHRDPLRLSVIDRRRIIPREDLLGLAHRRLVEIQAGSALGLSEELVDALIAVEASVAAVCPQASQETVG